MFSVSSVILVGSVFRGKGLGSFQNVISPAALTCSGVSVVSGPKYIYTVQYLLKLCTSAAGSLVAGYWVANSNVCPVAPETLQCRR